MIITAGVNILSQTKHTKRNGIIIEVSIGAGMAVTVRPELLAHLPEFLKIILASGITTGSIIALLLNAVLPDGDIIAETDEQSSDNSETESTPELLKTPQ